MMLLLNHSYSWNWLCNNLETTVRHPLVLKARNTVEVLLEITFVIYLITGVEGSPDWRHGVVF